MIPVRVDERSRYGEGIDSGGRRAVTGGIKDRLGNNSDSIKNRLGGAVGGGKGRFGDRVRVEVVEEEYTSEEEMPGKSAIKSLDLRGRIDTKGPDRRVVETDSEEESKEERILRRKLRKREKLLLRERKIEKMVREGKMDKMLLKEGRIAKKAKKREKEKLKSRVASVIDNVKITR